MARAFVGMRQRALRIQSTLSARSRSVVTVSSSLDLDSDLALQEARTWDQGLESQFATTPLSQIFKDKRVVIFGTPGAFTGVCTKGHVPSYTKNVEQLKSKGVDSVICVAVNDPYTINAWAEKMNAKGKIQFFADFDGSFHKSLGLECDLSKALLGLRSQRWSAFVDDGVVKVLKVEKVPSELKVSDGETMIKAIH
ncbi:peroxiredoxin-2F, mitochondrial [Selaginella moellendorffii]|nr:peroxiredoxin-2F, mitochondrial [Selaginella moellendorffii]|eukprot:XP_002960997.2 peroxiredoxin-2F, mitochondrial [Selaginella moellendorffii]